MVMANIITWATTVTSTGTTINTATNMAMITTTNTVMITITNTVMITTTNTVMITTTSTAIITNTPTTTSTTTTTNTAMITTTNMVTITTTNMVTITTTDTSTAMTIITDTNMVTDTNMATVTMDTTKSPRSSSPLRSPERLPRWGTSTSDAVLVLLQHRRSEPRLCRVYLPTCMIWKASCVVKCTEELDNALMKVRRLPSKQSSRSSEVTQNYAYTTRVTQTSYASLQIT
ncbi:hypothetical protein FHG87_004663 [Trinorchestia longiramus]|nr:hypothetical protein FHG87_004663 [Trinorchestia longiramus]